jgi:hypothetical protein
LQAHPFLADIPWEDVHVLRPPFVPGEFFFKRRAFKYSFQFFAFLLSIAK